MSDVPFKGMKVEFDSIDSSPPGKPTRPFRILFVSPLAGSAATDGQYAEVDREGFDEYLARVGPALDLSLANPLVPGSKVMEVNLAFNCLRDFRPSELALQIPVAREMLSLREFVESYGTGRIRWSELQTQAARIIGDRPELRWADPLFRREPAQAEPEPGAATLPPAEPATPDKKTDIIDDLFEKVETADDQKTTPSETDKSRESSALAGIIRQIGNSAEGTARPTAGEAERILHEIDTRLSLLLNCVMHAPAFCTLERAWRTLRFLVENVNFRAGVRIAALPATPDQMSDRLERCVVDPALDRRAEPPVLIVADLQLENTDPQIRLLGQLAELSVSLPAILAVGIGCSFMGVHQPSDCARLGNLRTHFDDWQFAKYNSFRKNPSAANAALVFGQFLLRDRYSADRSKRAAIRFDERITGDDDFVWGNGAAALAVLLARNAVQSIWPGTIVGPGYGTVDNLPVRPAPKTDQACAGDVVLSQDRLEQFADVGLNCLAAVPGQDQVVLWNQVTAAETAVPGAADISHRTFACQLAGLLLTVLPTLADQLDDEGLCSSVRSQLAGGLDLPEQTAGDVLRVTVRPAQNPGQSILKVEVRSPAQTGSAPVELEVAFDRRT